MISSPIDDTAILLTGATGFVGQYVLLDLLRSGRQVVVLARNRRVQSANARVESIMRYWEVKSRRLFIRPRVIASDLRDESNKLSVEDRNWISRHVGVVLHSAASVRFNEDERTGEPNASNFEGTKKLVELAIELSIPHFHHVSTAYVAGDRTGRVYESELNAGQILNNAYEQSKFDAEVFLQSQRNQFQSMTIHRPSIVVGDSQTGFTPSFHTIYALLRFARALTIKRSLEQVFFDLMKLTGNERKNLVSVDWLSNQITNVIGRPNCWNKTYHWTHPNPICGRTLFRSICGAVEACPSEWETIGKWIPTLDLTGAVDVHLDAYREYFRDDPIFDRRNAATVEQNPPPMITEEELTKRFSYAIQQKLQTFVFPSETIAEVGSDCPVSPKESGTSKETALPDDCISFELSGRCGGQWVIDLNGIPRQANNLPIAKVHVSGWAWQELKSKKRSVAELVRASKILISGPEYIRPTIASLIERMAAGNQNANRSELTGGHGRLGTVPGGASHE